jgi:hypothetical protein
METMSDTTHLPAALEGWRLAHRGLRRDATALAAAARSLVPGAREAALALADAAGLAARVGRLVHRFEDDVLFPAVVQRRPVFRDTLLQFAAEHEEIDDLARVVTVGLDALGASPRRPDEALRRVTHDADALRDLTVEHLDREVAASVAPLAALGRDEVAELGAALLATVDAADCAGLVLPWLSTCAPADRFAAVLAACTPAMRAAHERDAVQFLARFAPLQFEH